MKSLIKAVALAAILVAPVASFAQSSNQPLTRAEVREQLIQVEKAGYNPATANDYDYPANIQAAEARVAAQNANTQAAAQPGASGYGPNVSGTSQVGVRTSTTISSYSPPIANAR
ncbi:DUF4148 domain-containing protein [Paraburkholderia sp. DHOC27]|uniref:DUF4148 domain-containing protein n=1 Tax=Paraburkholderia sp. DHOC27 TaxID=2303330 RepID=UPI000E3D9BE9|nr:DUF4148 domain-containing protein [Paraburkholderia sp. DHOC27]RFU46266.1 DUF4148 domain-containing protein [Paraburkholderia sp. DHOC27]